MIVFDTSNRRWENVFFHKKSSNGGEVFFGHFKGHSRKLKSMFHNLKQRPHNQVNTGLSKQMISKGIGYSPERIRNHQHILHIKTSA